MSAADGTTAERPGERRTDLGRRGCIAMPHQTAPSIQFHIPSPGTGTGHARQREGEAIHRHEVRLEAHGRMQAQRQGVHDDMIEKVDERDEVIGVAIE